MMDLVQFVPINIDMQCYPGSKRIQKTAVVSKYVAHTFKSYKHVLQPHKLVHKAFSHVK